jgi:hypothetical protein
VRSVQFLPESRLLVESVRLISKEQRCSDMKIQPSGLSLYTTVDDELYDELSELSGQKVVYVEMWEDSLADALDQGETPATAPSATSNHFDLDLYLEDGVYFELYGAQCYADLDAEPWRGLDIAQKRLVGLVKRGLWLEEVAVNEDDGLVLVLSHKGEAQLYIDVGGWLIDEWDELPDG